MLHTSPSHSSLSSSHFFITLYTYSTHLATNSLPQLLHTPHIFRLNFSVLFFPLQNGEFRPPHSRGFNRSHHLVRSHEHPLWCRTASREENDDDFQGTTNSTCSCKYLPTLLSQCLRRREKEDEDERKRRSWREKWLMLASMHQQTTTSRRHLITQHQKDNK